MKNFLFFLLLSIFFFYPQGSQADYLGFSPENFNTLQFILKSRSMIVTDHETLPLYPPLQVGESENVFLWQKVFVDIDQEKLLSKAVISEEMPADFSQPSEVLVHSPTKITRIDHTRKLVYFPRLEYSQLEQVSLIFAGRMYENHLLSPLIEQASDDYQFDEEGEGYFLEVPEMSGVKLKLDENDRVIRLQDEKRTYFYDWKVKQPEHFAYVAHSVLEISERKTMIRVEMWVEKIELNPKLPENLFEIHYPENYTVRDLGELLTPPKF